jgi:hypothetical protein
MPYPSAEADERQRKKARREVGEMLAGIFDGLFQDAMTRLKNISDEDWQAAVDADEGEEAVA